MEGIWLTIRMIALQAIHGLSLEQIAVRRKQDLGLDLAEAVQNPLDAEIRRTGRPGGAQAGGRQHGNNGLGHVGHKADHPFSAV